MNSIDEGSVSTMTCTRLLTKRVIGCLIAIDFINLARFILQKLHATKQTVEV